MSISFCASMSNIVGQRVLCADGVEHARFDNFTDASKWCIDNEQAHLDGVAAVCGDEDCHYYHLYIEAVTDGPEIPEVNMSNTNAHVVMETLGINSHEQPAGEMDAQEFLGRVLMAQAVAPVSAEQPAHDMSRAGGPTVIHCGRPEGYVQMRLDELHDLAQFAVTHERTIMWG